MYTFLITFYYASDDQVTEDRRGGAQGYAGTRCQLTSLAFPYHPPIISALQSPLLRRKGDFKLDLFSLTYCAKLQT